jgi:hypothetical protein
VPRALKLDSDGHLSVREAELQSTITDFLRLYRWEVVVTNASDQRRNGAPSHNAGTADLLAIRPAGEPGKLEGFWAELKRRKARTAKHRRATQAAFEADMSQRGFLCYRCPDGHPDPWQHFQDWFKEHWN